MVINPVSLRISLKCKIFTRPAHCIEELTHGMTLLIENQTLKLEYKKGFGAWTYHLRIPGTAAIEGRWGFLKVSGTIDGYEIKSMNLAPRKNEDKILSINKQIRDAIGKSGGDPVLVTLFLHD